MRMSRISPIASVPTSEIEKSALSFKVSNLIPNLNIHDNVAAPLHYRRMPAAERSVRVKDALEKVGLTSRKGHFPAQLSGGQQQRAAIARAIGGGGPQVISCRRAHR